MSSDRLVAPPTEPEDPRLVLVVDDDPMMRLLGFETCRRLRESSFGRHTPILMMTALEDLESIRRSYEVGATDFVNKPINWLILEQRVEYMLRASRTADDLRHSQSRLADAQRIARLGYWELFPGSRRLRCSSQLARILDRPVDALPGNAEELVALVHPEDRESVERSLETALRGLAPETLEYRLRLADGEDRWVRQEAEIKHDEEGMVIHVAAAVQDITRRKHAAETIRKLSYFDELTGLPNRRSFVEQFEQARHSARRYDRTMAVVALDLDRLKQVNETLGHGAGDEVLRETAERLLGTLRSSDVLSRPASSGGTAPRLDFVARLGGDEFVILLTEVGRAQDAAAVAGRIASVLGAPFTPSGGKVYLSTSIGIAIYPHDGDDAESLIQRSTTARNHAKAQGGDCYRFFDASMNAAALERLHLEAALHLALERREFEVWYQPQLDIENGRLVAAEALLRWRHPQRGLIPPMDFIPMAEETGLIEQLGEWCLREACARAFEWNRNRRTPLRVAVNVSGRQFESGTFLGTVTRALRDTGLAPQLLELELTEGVLMQDVDGAVETLAALRALGPKLAIDDFGIGYSSLNYLMRFGVDRLKIDRSFVAGLPMENRGIVRAMISMARSMGLEVLGEGVEDEDQLEFLRTEGCDHIQGFLLGKPTPASEFEERLEDPPGQAKRSPRIAATG
jgi:predicted signal transduction protein with EAL and GGDEF domain